MRTLMAIPLLCVSACGVLCGASSASTMDERVLAGYLDRMESPDWVERQSASESMLTDDRVSMDEMLSALSLADLSHEQHARLSEVAARRFRLEPLAGLGVQFGNAGQGAVTISATVEGFPAARVIQANDVVLAIGDRLGTGLVGGQDDLRAEILSRRPGEVMPVIVRRENRTLQLDLPLGSYANLQGAAMLDGPTIRDAIDRRRSRLYPEPGDSDGRGVVIGSGLEAPVWIEAAFPLGVEPGVPGGNERRDPPVVGGGPERLYTGRRGWTLLRGFWGDAGEAAQDAGEHARDTVSRAMSRGVLLRGVLLEHERSLASELDAARQAGEPSVELERSLATLREDLATLDTELTATARRLEQMERAIERAGGGEASD